jgi:arginine exporter protein ArgO
MEAFLAGAIAGFGIAIPVGAIAVLIMQVGIRSGFATAVAAGAGAATADGLYAAVAVIGGAALAAAVNGIGQPLQVTSALVLGVVAVVGLARSGRGNQPAPGADSSGSRLKVYASFVGLTIINPTTIVYFAAVVIGLGATAEIRGASGVFFAMGAFLASLTWQCLLALTGAVAGKRLSPGVQRVLSIVGNLVILTLAVVILFR